MAAHALYRYTRFLIVQADLNMSEIPAANVSLKHGNKQIMLLTAN